MASKVNREIDLKLSKKEKKERDRMLGLISKAFGFSQKFFEDRAKYERRYMNDLDVEKADWQAQIAHPQAHITVERKASFLTDATMGAASRPLFKVRPWNNFDALSKAEANTKFMHKQQSEMELTETFYKAYKMMFIHGTSILHTFWDNQIEVHEQEPAPKVVFDQEKGQLAIKNVKPPPEIVTRTDRPGIELVNINDFWPDPAATSLEDARYVCRRKFISHNELKHLEKLGRLKNVDLLKGTIIPRREFQQWQSNRLGRYSAHRQFRDDRAYEFANADPENPIHEIIEFYEPGKISVIGNGKVPLDIGRTIYRARFPFARFANLPQAGDFFGMSEFIVCERLLAHIDQMQNMIFDNWEKHLKGITLVESGVSDISLKQLQQGNPGDVIRINDIDGIKTERPDLFDASVVQGMQILLQECKDAMSVEGAISGTSPGSEVRDSQSFEVFTRISQVTLSVMVRRIQEALRSLGRQWLALNKQFLKETIKIRVAGAEALDTMKTGEVIIDPKDPKDIPLNADVDVQLTSIADVRRDREIRQMVEGINLAIQDPTFRANEALLQLFSKLDAFDNVLNLFEQDPQKILQKAQINAVAAGKRTPTLAGRLSSGQPATARDTGGAPPQAALA